jgi:hypothetical protein
MIDLMLVMLPAALSKATLSTDSEAVQLLHEKTLQECNVPHQCLPGWSLSDHDAAPKHVHAQ